MGGKGQTTDKTLMANVFGPGGLSVTFCIGGIVSITRMLAQFETYGQFYNWRIVKRFFHWNSRFFRTKKLFWSDLFSTSDVVSVARWSLHSMPNFISRIIPKLAKMNTRNWYTPGKYQLIKYMFTKNIFQYQNCKVNRWYVYLNMMISMNAWRYKRS